MLARRESRELEAWQALGPWGVGPDEGDELFRKCWGAAYVSSNAARGVGCLLGLMDELIAACETRAIEVPASFREARKCLGQFSISAARRTVHRQAWVTS